MTRIGFGSEAQALARAPLKSVLATGALPHGRATAPICSAPFGLGYLRDDLTKLPKAMFLVRDEQRSFRIQDPVVRLLQIPQIGGPAPKKLAQQTLGPVAIDRLVNRLGRG